jgi:polyisoprenoid-binding protein YceI
MLVFKRSAVGALILMLAACGAPRPRPHEPQKPGDAGGAAMLPASGETYRIDEAGSEVRVLVYRAGPLARLGHNHVVVNRALRGEVNLSAGAGSFWLTLPAASFVVDDAAARHEEGAAFDNAVPDDAKAGTLQNMLSPALLDAADFPAIAVKSTAVTVRPGTQGTGEMSAAVVIEVAGHESTKILPFTLQKDSERLTATGSAELRQSDLGLTPYSLMLGALQVQDAITVKFTIVAIRG